MNLSDDFTIGEHRSYRSFDTHDVFTSFRVVVETSDLYIRALKNLQKEARSLIVECRSQIERSIARRPEFLTNLDPMEVAPFDTPVVAKMIHAGKKAGVGPMAAVAGTVAEFVGRNLLPSSEEIIVENGGDVFIHVKRPIVIGIYAGKITLGAKFGIKIGPTLIPTGVCTSSAKIGPSISFGRTDAATVVSSDVSLADAVATGLGNRIKTTRDLKPAVQWACNLDGVQGALAIFEDKIAVQGDLELVPIG
jgi:uncharacterized protein